MNQAEGLAANLRAQKKHEILSKKRGYTAASYIEEREPEKGYADAHHEEEKEEEEKEETLPEILQRPHKEDVPTTADKRAIEEKKMEKMEVTKKSDGKMVYKRKDGEKAGNPGNSSGP
jgi:hypothetical protein